MSAPGEQEAGHPAPNGVGESPAGIVETAVPGESAGAFARNSILSISRVLVTALIAIVLPAYLTHRLPVVTYAAWVLILQVSAYVAYLDFGIQSGISKYVAEFQARNDPEGSSMRASAGLALMLITSLLGVALTLVLAWQVPRLFNEMPPTLYRDVRFSIIFVGISVSFGLLCSIFSSIFFGLQRFAVPIILSIANRILYTAVVVAAVALHQGLAVMGALVAVVNIATGVLQFEAWRRLAKTVRLSLYGLNMDVVRKMLVYCSSLAIWTAGMLCVSGLDVTIVGKYDFSQTAFYSIATLPTNLVTALLGAALAPLMPTASALSVHRSPDQMGVVLSRATRYASTILVTTGIPLLVAGYWVLRLWVGPVYAMHTIQFLRILVLANILRNMGMPYASMLVATESQRIAIAGAVAEAAVNVACSLYLVRHIGAIGVAYGTLIGSFVSIGVHFTVNMHFTRPKFAISRARLFMAGLGRPALIAIPSLILVRYWWSNSAPAFGLPAWFAWGLSSALLACFAGLTAEERHGLVRLASTRLQDACKI
jgi:O-antigen/teichoic acid export membrane protein